MSAPVPAITHDDLPTSLAGEYQRQTQTAELADNAQDRPGAVYEARDAVHRVGGDR